MKNFQFLEKYQLLQYTIMYNRLYDLKHSSVSIGDAYTSPFFNLAQTDTNLSLKQLDEIETIMKKESRKPTVYFENKSELGTLKRNLKGHGYLKNWEDSWMFHNGEGVDISKFKWVKKVESRRELNLFLKTFDKCYVKDDPQNPYGELGSYLDAAKESWQRHNVSGRIEYFMVLRGRDPVAVSTLTNFAGLGYISNVGSILEVRGQGFGKIASLYCVEKSIKNENELHCLATEEGTYPNEFYKGIGFETRFTALGFVKKV